MTGQICNNVLMEMLLLQRTIVPHQRCGGGSGRTPGRVYWLQRGRLTAHTDTSKKSLPEPAATDATTPLPKAS